MERCQFGDKCYRKNIDHLETYHPERMKEVEKKNKTSNIERKKEKANLEKRNVAKTQNSKIDQFFKGKADKRGIENLTPTEINASAAKRHKEDKDVPIANESSSVNAVTITSNENNESLAKTNNFAKDYYHVDDTIRDFWNHLLTIDEENPRKVFSKYKNSILVGVFEQLEGSLNKTEEELHMYNRHPTDLPEMETVLICDGGHYAIWRDEPFDKNFLIVHSDGGLHFPQIKIVGASFDSMVAHLVGDDLKDSEKLLVGSADMVKKENATAIKNRKRIRLGNPPHPLGICVKVENDVGYRPVPEEPRNLKRFLSTIGTTDVEEIRKKNMSKISEIFTYVQFANDESDFGMGLEFGHWLFLANYRPLDKMTLFSLKTAYQLLDRDRYADIVVAAIEKRKNGA